MPLGRALIFALAALVVLVSPEARAETSKVQCIQANTNAQSLRREGKLAAAREQLRLCSDAKCPGLVVTDCVKRLDELETVQPTVVFDVVDTAGSEINDVVVSMDGQRLVDKLTGTSVPVDLGEHRVRFAASGRASVEQRFVFREGEKSRHVRVTIPAAPGNAVTATSAPTPMPAPAPTPTPAPDAPSEPVAPPPANVEAQASKSAPGRGQRIAGYAVGGAGLLGLAVGGWFGYLTVSAKREQIDNCESAMKCPNYEVARAAHEDGKTNGLISTVAFIVGGAAAATGVVLLLTAKSGTSEASGRPLSLSASAVPGGASVDLGGSF